MKRAPKDGHTRQENLHTQPLRRHRVFNNPEVLSEGWYLVCESRRLGRGQAESFRIGQQRIVVFRGEDGRARALDAFCPHMGADLANGAVIGNELRCYFHHWQFDDRGVCTQARSADRPTATCSASGENIPAGHPEARLVAYPIEERYGFLWVYSASVAAHPFPTCPGLEGAEVAALHLGRVRLYAHHHAMMAGGIDLQHFATVHELDVDFELDTKERDAGVVDWNLSGRLPPQRNLKSRLGRALLGERVGYSLRFAGGSIAAITYGRDQRLFGTGPALPSLHILWGCTPQPSGVSDVDIFLLAKKRPGLWGRLAAPALLGLTALLLKILQDDDVKAFPNMRFDPKCLIEADTSVARFIQYTNGLPVSAWSKTAPELVTLRPRRARLGGESGEARRGGEGLVARGEGVAS